eukprot:TRINITY_DN16396_c0_g2_i1.p1 TRINITY_DN16396_c0_g2~~TRINITY_DN16396_c0_g2_i1.p1  ORF type:complete len:315 (+),score=25.13 TRINITY_DN16396_c0_g2_i1:111-947(+)
MVEEMMLLANITVGRYILEKFRPCALLRRHPEPPARLFEPLLQAAATLGIVIDISSSKALAESLDKAQRSDDPYFNKLIRIMCTRCMTQAVYFNSGEFSEKDYMHYGLATPIYTHFTSPIRRYADVVVHRLLAAAMGLNTLPEAIRDRNNMQLVVDNLNTRNRNAQMAGRASVELHTVIFFDKKNTIADARVTRVRANGLIVFVPKFGIEGPVRFEQGNFTLEEQGAVVKDQQSGKQFVIFDKVAVRISVETSPTYHKQLVLQLVDRSLLSQKDRQQD